MITRQLYTDDGEQIFESERPVCMNGILDIVTKPDLLDRSLFVPLDEIAEDRRKTEKRFWQEFKEAQPRILGALLTAVAHGMAQPKDDTLKLPRTADFAEWVTYCEGAFGWPAGTFLEACRRNAENNARIVLDSDPVAGAIRDMMDREPPQPDGSKLWEGLTSALLKKLRAEIGETTYRVSDMPKAANALSGHLRRAAAALAKAGIIVKQERVTQGGWVKIFVNAPAPTTSSKTSSSSSSSSSTCCDQPAQQASGASNDEQHARQTQQTQQVGDDDDDDDGVLAKLSAGRCDAHATGNHKTQEPEPTLEDLELEEDLGRPKSESNAESPVRDQEPKNRRQRAGAPSDIPVRKVYRRAVRS
jgi:hypothetical protein